MYLRLIGEAIGLGAMLMSIQGRTDEAGFPYAPRRRSRLDSRPGQPTPSDFETCAERQP